MQNVRIAKSREKDLKQALGIVSSALYMFGVSRGTRFYIAGGSIFSILKGKPYNDIDVYFYDEATFNKVDKAIGDGFECTGAELKSMLKYLMKLTKEENPEEFI